MFESCSAYHPSRMNVLFLCHCVPNPPNKGEKIRAYYEIEALARRHQVHLACFARNEEDLEFAEALRGRCASVHAELLPFASSLLRGAVQFALGRCLNLAFFESGRMRHYVRELAAKVPFHTTIAYTLPMMPYAPPAVPILFDMLDVDSEKWLQYGRMKRFGFLYRAEAHRIRRHELESARKAEVTYLAARQETALFRSLAPEANLECMENGVDLSFFDPAIVPFPESLRSKRFVSFVGTMDYYPNIDAACWFAREVFPKIRQRHPGTEFLVVGNNPGKAALQLKQIPGVTVTGGVPDVRPYILHAQAVLAPLRLARGIQNKVLEALALGRNVYTTSAVARTFGDEVPPAVHRCDSAEEYVKALEPELNRAPQWDPVVREYMRVRFSWEQNVSHMVSRLESLVYQAVG